MGVKLAGLQMTGAQIDTARGERKDGEDGGHAGLMPMERYR